MTFLRCLSYLIILNLNTFPWNTNHELHKKQTINTIVTMQLNDLRSGLPKSVHLLVTNKHYCIEVW